MGMIHRPRKSQFIACPVNDECVTATTIRRLPFSAIELTCDATQNPLDPTCVTDEYFSVWFKFTAPRNMTIGANTIHSNYDTILGVYTGTCANLTEVACSDDDGPGYTSLVFFEALAGKTYYFKASGFDNDDCGQLFLNIFQVPPYANGIEIGAITRLAASKKQK
ncbi:hypothetical protein BEP19_09460 [Ammoniphilus oxalaticus]|uniref:T9SS-like galactose binding domain-containing protein n=1 Tax=Ammoniphilus oxalaticus TaxID=66863 RepID=A0A419SKR0_9BACL|nr:hypothetical protein [Ammoniphilus oxalaticus]RKD24594.1 hypothetical protein BEP19_09460 [Ammoniphilus oxalaticus]